MLQLQSLRLAAWLAPLAVGLVACDTTAPGTRPLSRFFPLVMSVLVRLLAAGLLLPE